MLDTIKEFLFMLLLLIFMLFGFKPPMPNPFMPTPVPPVYPPQSPVGPGDSVPQANTRAWLPASRPTIAIPAAARPRYGRTDLIPPASGGTQSIGLVNPSGLPRPPADTSSGRRISRVGGSSSTISSTASSRTRPAAKGPDAGVAFLGLGVLGSAGALAWWLRRRG